jgi:hypothetical protein
LWVEHGGHGPVLVAQEALAQVAKPGAGREGHGAGVGTLQSGDDAQQRRLAAAVRAHDAGALAVPHAERHAQQNRRAGVVFLQVTDP